MQVILGVVLLLSHVTSRRLKADRAAVWFAAGVISGGVGLLLQSESKVLWPVAGVLLGNVLFLAELILMTRAVAEVTQQRYRWAVLLQGLVGLVLLAVEARFTWWVPSQSSRVLAAMLLVPCILAVAVAVLLRARDRVTRPATLALAGLLGMLAAGMLARAWSVAHGLMLVTGASWAGTVFIAGVALCFLWLEMLRVSSQLEDKAMSDPLTGLLNRRAIETFACRELARCQRQGQAIAALMIDMNGFKQVNDLHGHSVGDVALERVADAIRESLRAVDLAARIGGDEFLVLLPDASEVTVRTVTGRLHSAIDRLEVPTGLNGVLRVSATIGHARSAAGDVTLEDLMQHSDDHLYEQKRESRTPVAGGGTGKLPAAV